MFINTKIAICVVVVIGAASAAVAKDQTRAEIKPRLHRRSSRMPIEPYGTNAEVQQCGEHGGASERARHPRLA